MFLHSLLVLLVAIQVTLACQCNPLTLLQAMCTRRTVVRARVENVEDVLLETVPFRRYRLTDEHIFNTEQRQLSKKDGYYHLLFPVRSSNCGQILNDNMDYVIAGNVDQNGDLMSSMRLHIAPYEYIARNAHFASILRDVCVLQYTTQAIVSYTHLECEEERAEAARLLVEHGACRATLNKDEKTPLDLVSLGFKQALETISERAGR